MIYLTPKADKYIPVIHIKLPSHHYIHIFNMLMVTQLKFILQQSIIIRKTKEGIQVPLVLYEHKSGSTVMCKLKYLVRFADADITLKDRLYCFKAAFHGISHDDRLYNNTCQQINMTRAYCILSHFFFIAENLETMSFRQSFSPTQTYHGWLLVLYFRACCFWSIL